MWWSNKDTTNWSRCELIVHASRSMRMSEVAIPEPDRFQKYDVLAEHRLIYSFLLHGVMSACFDHKWKKSRRKSEKGQESLIIVRKLFRPKAF